MNLYARAGINFEHSWGDGVAVLRYFQEIFKETTKAPFVHPGQKGGPTQGTQDGVFPIEFTVDETVRNALRVAENNHNAVIDSLDMNFMKYEGMNKGFCKQQRISPDSVMQLGFQLAFYKQHGQFVGTYESCSTAAFRHGRTETMRPCTVATKEFCLEVERKTGERKTAAELREILNRCSTVHGQLTKEAAMGQGFDRHLFGLRHTAQRNGLSVPALYEDPAYAAINHNILSTSTLSSPALLAGGFGPVVRDGYGIGYNIQDGYLGSVVSSYKPHRNGREFVDCLRDAYEDIAKVLKATGPPSKDK
ncbi:carnitine O-palmitoyltransferase 2, mitochondrial-like [Anopheles bellator]|uniref:carnitine O-palmitoyltransferase 2, mitochondrial-like n=1 Tax=Anopheles bellator TaxID=139047 RepID=UPI0026493F8A|nr:carnitine O-palmitoyltransferase 2, mitochondrial-like [Anopheles bellator]